MNSFRADLHCHSHCSDGSDPPETLLKKAKQIGLSGLSITDHDTIDAYTPELFALAKELGIRLLPGIELSSEWDKTAVHVLGYGIDLKSQALIDFLAEMIQRRKTRNRAIIAKLQQKGFSIQFEELETHFPARTIGRPHIAGLLLQKGHVRSIPEAFEKYLREGACCYAPGIKYSPADVIEEIHRAGGKAVLAHPHFIKSGSHLRQLLNLPFDGLECYYGTLHKTQERPWIEKAKKKGWIATGGSDYHGAVKANIPLGSSWVNEETFLLLNNVH